MNVLKDILGEELSYTKQPKGFGQGELRIGGVIELDEDIFSLAFVITLKDKYVNKYFNIVGGDFW